ncbi:hypothetical protein ACIQBJ_29760 [Kitasatospora sp. NPDC088391]|uniref:hypothetical protein n=1 Tax=Kitasatospora sp. NPDC088391 TaxID=3364074 RepID=UPI0037F6A9F1
MTTENPSTERATDTDRTTGIGSADGAGATRGRFVPTTPPVPGTDRADAPRADRTNGTATGTVPAPRGDRTNPDPRADRTSTGTDTGTGTGRTNTAPHPADMTKTAEPARPRSTAGNPAAADEADLLLPPELTSRLTGRLDHAVGTFVDDPDRAVQEADEALEETVRVLTDRLQERRTALRDAWRNGGERGAADASSRTEDLRLSLRAYRDLLHRLLAA